MSALISAELLRLRTVRSTPWIVAGGLAFPDGGRRDAQHRRDRRAQPTAG